MTDAASANSRGVCTVCGSQHSLTFHHLIPKSCHKNKWFKKNFDAAEMRERGMVVCRKCHSFIHKQFNEKQLGRELNTPEAILTHETVKRFAVWKAKQH